MDYGRPHLADRLAADYVIGTLRGGARRRFERLLPAHPTLTEATLAWAHRLQLLAGQVEPVEPPARVWTALQTRLFGAANDATAPAESTHRSDVRSLRFWRGLSALAVAASVVMGAVVLRPAPEAPPIVVVLHSTPQGVELVKTGFVASVSADGRSLVLKPLAPVAVDPKHALELWAIPKSGAPRSLGLVRPGQDPTTVMRASLLDAKAFAISLEPDGGSPTGQPTGPIVSSGGI